MKPEYILWVGVALFLVAVLKLELPYLGMVTSVITQGGNVTEVNISPIVNIWQGFFGNITTNQITTVTFDGFESNVSRFDVNLTRCFDTELYATPRIIDTLPSSAFMNSLTAATASNVDTFLNLSNTSVFSATKIFTNTTSFGVGSNTLSVPSTTTVAQLGSYNIGILKDTNGTLVFVSDLRNASRGFNDEEVHFQLLLPAPLTTNLTYFFFQDVADDADCAFFAPAPPAPVAPAVAGGGAPSRVERIRPCAPYWICFSWSECIEGAQTRTCTDMNRCPNATTPVMRRTCKEELPDPCADGVQQAWEEGVDCGGPCVPCAKQKQYARPVIELERPVWFAPQQPEKESVFRMIATIALLIAILFIAAKLLETKEKHRR